MRSQFPPSAYFMWRLFTYRPWPQVVSGLCWVFFHSWPLFPGLLAKAFFDLLEGRTQGAAAANLSLANIVLLVVILAVVRISFVYLDTQVGIPTGFSVRGLIQRNLLACILDRPGAQALPESAGEAISTLRDDVDTMWGAGWAFDVVGFSVFALGGLAILLVVDAKVTLLVFIPIITVITLAHVARTRLRSLRAQSRMATAQVTGAIGEIFSAVQAIQVAGAEARVINHLRRLNTARQQAMLRDRLLGLALGAVFESTASLGAGLTLLAAASALRSGEFTIGDFALFSTYLVQVAGMTGFLGWIVATYQQMGVAFRRGVALMQGAPPSQLVAHHPIDLQKSSPQAETPSFAPSATPAEPLKSLAVQGATVRFPNGEYGIKEISFTLERGSFTVITGKIGSGKTTLVRAVLGLHALDSGIVLWNGEQIASLADFMTPPRVAYTPQVPTLLSGTLRENILLGWPATNLEINEAIHRAVFESDLAGFPDRLETVIGARGVRLSGGQIQRVAAARMFVRQAELLVFDDLSSALDVETEQLLWQRVFALPTTCLVVSHRRMVLERADQILLLEGGRLAGKGRLADLLKRSPTMRQIYAGGEEKVQGHWHKPDPSQLYPGGASALPGWVAR